MTLHVTFGTYESKHRFNIKLLTHFTTQTNENRYNAQTIHIDQLRASVFENSHSSRFRVLSIYCSIYFVGREINSETDSENDSEEDVSDSDTNG